MANYPAREVSLGENPRQFYTKEFKEEAVKLVTEVGLGIAEASRRLSISEQTLRNWIKQLKAGKPLTATRTASELEIEISRLRRELAETRLERDILKKAMAYLAKGAQRYALMETLRQDHGYAVERTCRVFGVSRSGFFRSCCGSSVCSPR